MLFSTCTCIWILLLTSCAKSEENKAKCELAAFIENADGTNPMLIDSGPVHPTNELKSCKENAGDCAKMAEEQAIDGTNGGNFTLVVDQRNGYTIGDILCDKADAVEENVKNKFVHIYWRICELPWKPTAFKMPQPLCCDDGLYVPCRTIKLEL